MKEKNKINLSENKKDIIIIVLLIIISSILIFNNLGANSIRAWDEARHAENARQILLTNDWIVTKYLGQIDLFNLKPPFGAWLIAISFKIFDISEFSIRLPSAMFGIALIVLTYLFGKAILNRNVGIFSSILLMLLPGLFFKDGGWRAAEVDIIVSFFIVASLLFFFNSLKDKKWLIVCLASVALGFLTKGIVGLLPVPIIIISLLLSKRFGEFLKSKQFKQSILTFLIITLPWVILRLIKEPTFLFYMIGFDTLQRFYPGVYNHTGSGDYLFYFQSLANYFINPLTILLLISALLYLAVNIKKEKEGIKLVSSWVIFIFIIFTIASVKFDRYLVPALPGFILMIGYVIEKVRIRFKIKTWIMLILLLLILIPSITVVNEKTKEVKINTEVKFIKSIKQNLSNTSNLYILDKQPLPRQDLHFYTAQYINGQVYPYQDINHLPTISKNDAVLAINEESYSSLINSSDYKLINKADTIALFTLK